MSNNAALRPTSDRVRETLFNWLNPVIEGANCLDLYAGSGVLGFEALSRGAASVTMVEQNRDTVDMLAKQAKALQASQVNIICDDAGNYLIGPTQKFDIVFLDPPFSKNLLQKACETLLNKGHLHSDSLVYVESDSEIAVTAPYTVFKQARAGRVRFMLLGNDLGRKIKNDNSDISGYI